MEIWLVSDWNVDSFLGKHIRNGKFNYNFFADLEKKRSKVSVQLQIWKDHLAAKNDLEFIEFCSVLHFKVGYQYDDLWNSTKDRMFYYKLKGNDSSIFAGIGIVREWIKDGRPQKITDKDLLRQIGQKDLWNETYNYDLPIHQIEKRFAQETTKVISNIRQEIKGVGFIERDEINEIEEQLQKNKLVVIVGEAGTGKSGIAATLANYGSEQEKIVLLLDARRIVHIQDEASLKNYLDLDCPIKAAIEEANDYKGFRLIIDQLDNVAGSPTGVLLKSLALDLYAIPKLEIVIISRRIPKVYSIADEIEELTKKGFVEQTSKLLDEVKTRNALIALDIKEHNQELVELASNLLHLEIISLIRHETPSFSEFTSLIDKIILWEKYLEVISNKESKFSGSDHAVAVIREAIRIAQFSLKTGSIEISLDSPVSKIQKRLIGTILIHLSGHLYRFRHEELQYFLYAREATSLGKMASDVFDDIGDTARNVLPKMRMIYSREAYDSEYTSTLYRQFLTGGFEW
jgi:hypothetical protein